MIRRSKPIKRTALKRGPGRKGLREQDALAAFRNALWERSGGECEGRGGGLVNGEYVFIPHERRGRHEGTDCHHLFPEDRDCGIHDPARGMLLCRRCHNWIDQFPVEAKALGLLRPDWKENR